MAEKTKGEELKEKLFNKRKSGWLGLNEQQANQVQEFNEGYIDFLNKVKTEREAVTYIKQIADKNGFKDINSYATLKPGDKVYYINRGKNIFLAIIGTDDIRNGLNIVGSHVDSPRLDLKPNPLYEDSSIAYLKTHYYGGIKKYQWTAIPLSIHGIVVKPNGEKIEINIGEKESDPIFTISDLLPHLSQQQSEKKLKEAIQGEDLNILVGNIPFDEKTSESVKLNILKILNEKYNITEIDFLSSELELVPAFAAKSAGFDKSMVAGYGQDDRVCAYTSLQSILNIKNPKTTAICLVSDKEEIGSVGNTGMESEIFDTFIEDILDKMNINKSGTLGKIYRYSKMLSADVDAAYDPIYASVSDKYNSAYLGEGIGLNKYTGARGKSGSSDANAEFMAFVRNLFESNDIKYQVCELGKVDAGGGGTIAYIFANKGMDVVDCGVGVLSMHAPYEVVSKFDVFTAYRAYKAFFEN